MRRKLMCAVWLVVITPYAGVARWARQPVPNYQPDSRFVPLVVGLEEIPWVTSEEMARQYPELTVLSAVVHGNEPGGVKVVRSGLLAADGIAGRGGPAYHALILSALNEASAAILREMMMRNEEQIAEEVAQSYFGRIAVAKGKTENIFAVLSARGIPVNDEVKGRILACQDLATLDRWIRRAATAATADEVVAH